MHAIRSYETERSRPILFFGLHALIAAVGVRPVQQIVIRHKNTRWYE